MLKLQSKTALVTGASKGIGAGIALELATVGASVVVNYASDKRGAEAVAHAIIDAGGRAITIQGDVANSADDALGTYRDTTGHSASRSLSCLG